MKRIVPFLLCVAAAVAQPTQTTITDTLYNPASNALLEGTIRIELMTGGATSNQAHVFGERTLTIASGALSLTLPPNSTMSPSGSYYRVTKSLRPAGTSERYRVSTVTWTVPTSATCSGGVCRVADIESITAPTPSGTVNISRLTSSCAENQTFVWNGFNFACSNVLGANPMEAVGDTLYGNSSGVLRRLAGNTTTTRKYLLSVGDGSAANVPAWTQPAASDLSNGTTGSGNVVLATGPTITSATISGSLTGNASTATALAANGTNCTAGQFPLGVDASGASESCTALPTTIAGTANQITASASTGAITLSLPSTITGLTSVTSTSFVGALTGNASTATALAANPADCSANQYATGIAASGDLTCAQPAASNLSNGTTGTGLIVLASSPTIVTPTIASFANATHSHQNAAGGGTLAGASALSDYSTAFVTSITGTSNQVTASASVGGVTLSLPQSIHTGATPTFAGLTSPSLTYAGTLALSATGSNTIKLSVNSVEQASVTIAGLTVGTATAAKRISFPALTSGRGPVAIDYGEKVLNGTNDPTAVFGYNQTVDGYLLTSAEPAIGFVVEGNYNDLSGANKAEQYFQYIGADGTTIVRPISTQINRSNNRITSTTIAGGTGSLKLGIQDGTGTAEEQVTGKVKLQIESSVTRSYNETWLESTNPILVFYDINGGPNLKFFRLTYNGGKLAIEKVNDAYDTTASVVVFDQATVASRFYGNVGIGVDATYPLDVSGGTMRVYDQTLLTGVTRARFTPGVAQSTVPLLSATVGSDFTFGLGDTEVLRLSGSGLVSVTHSGANGSAHPVISMSVGADGTHGPLNLTVGAYPSATGSSRYTYLQAGDGSDYREIRINPTGGAVRIAASGGNIGFFGVTPVARQTATDLAGVIAALQAYGLLN